MSDKLSKLKRAAIVIVSLMGLLAILMSVILPGLVLLDGPADETQIPVATEVTPEETNSEAAEAESTDAKASQ